MEIQALPNPWELLKDHQGITHKTQKLATQGIIFMKNILMALCIVSSIVFAEDEIRDDMNPPSFPLCGVLTNQGYTNENSLALLVPRHLNQASVARYHIFATQELGIPLETYAGWWVCVEKGEIIFEAVGEEYGKIRADQLRSDQSTGERGQE